MKHTFESYNYYFFGSRFFDKTIRYEVILKQPVNVEALKESVKRYCDKHSWIKVKPSHHFSYDDLVANDLPIKVEPLTHKRLKFGKKETNYHLVFVEYIDNTIYFNVSHFLVGGVALTKAIIKILNIYLSIIDKNYELKEEDPLELEKEFAFPSLEEFKNVKANFELPKKKRYFLPVLGLLETTLLKKNMVAVKYEFDSTQLMKVARGFEASPSVLFAALYYKMLIKLYPKKKRLYLARIMKNPLLSFEKYSSSHGFINSNYIQMFPYEAKDFSLQKLCTIVRGTTFIATDPSVNGVVIKKALEFNDSLDKTLTKFGRIIKSTLFHPCEGAFNSLYSFMISYNAQNVEPQLENLVDGLYLFTESVFLVELTSLNNRFFLSFHLGKNHKKYTDCFEEVLKENNIPYTYHGVEKRNLFKNR